MHAIVLVAFARVAPVDHIDRSIGTVIQVDAAEPFVFRQSDIGLVAGDVARAFTLEPIDVDPPAVQIERQQLSAVFGGPIIAQINARAAVGMSAAELVASGVAFAGPPATAVVVME